MSTNSISKKNLLKKYQFHEPSAMRQISVMKRNIKRQTSQTDIELNEQLTEFITK